MGTGFAKKKKQARQMQEQLGKWQEDMKNTEVTGNAGAELVSVTLNGHHELLKIRINPDCVDKEDVEGLEDLIKAAYNDAKQKLSEIDQGGGGGGIPNLSSLGF